ncbi:MAG: sugar phosphate isomerase/epimerase [Clostridia bacterium]|nr:sugar phosphate isomerase/epimerase [Clostridia bacterium]
MKFGVSSYSFSKYIMSTKCDYFKICDIAKEIGYDGIEFINLDNKNFGITDDPIKTAREIREYCAKIGLDVIAYTVGANFLSPDIEGEMARIKGCVDVAAELGAPLMRHDVCYSLPADPMYSWREAIVDMKDRINEISEYAKAKGIRTCSENHGYIFQAPERVEALIRAVNNPNYGWLCDMGNFLCSDSDPVKAVTLAARYTIHVHAKDFLYKDGSLPRPDGFFGTAGGNHIRGTVLGHGVVPVAQCVKILAAAGYDKYVSVEFEGMEDNIAALKAGFNYLKNNC